jgi:excisionase family DNA binding protein
MSERIGSRLLLSIEEAADLLDISSKTLRRHVAAGEIPYVLIGRRTRKFAQQDLDAFIARRRRQEEPCPSTSRKGRRGGTMTSSSGVFDFMAARAQRTGKRPSR